MKYPIAAIIIATAASASSEAARPSNAIYVGYCIGCAVWQPERKDVDDDANHRHEPRGAQSNSVAFIPSAEMAAGVQSPAAAPDTLVADHSEMLPDASSAEIDHVMGASPPKEGIINDEMPMSKSEERGEEQSYAQGVALSMLLVAIAALFVYNNNTDGDEISPSVEGNEQEVEEEEFASVELAPTEDSDDDDSAPPPTGDVESQSVSSHHLCRAGSLSSISTGATSTASSAGTISPEKAVDEQSLLDAGNVTFEICLYQGVRHPLADNGGELPKK